MANFYRRIPRYVPAFAEALGVKSPEQMKYLREVNGRLVFIPPKINSQTINFDSKKTNKPTTDDKIVEPYKLVEPVNSQPAEKPEVVNNNSGSGLKIRLSGPANFPPNLPAYSHTEYPDAVWNSNLVRLMRPRIQVTSPKLITGETIRNELLKQHYKFHNSHLLKWLYVNQWKIPVWWRSRKQIFFLGTTYALSIDERVLGIFFDKNKLQWFLRIRSIKNDVFEHDCYWACW